MWVLRACAGHVRGLLALQHLRQQRRPLGHRALQLRHHVLIPRHRRRIPFWQPRQHQPCVTCAALSSFCTVYVMRPAAA